MPATLFLQSEIADPYELYKNMLKENPVYWDSTNNLWTVYSYNDCKTILANPFAQIPEVNSLHNTGLNKYALAISGKLARLSNGVQHEIARQAAMMLFDNMRTISIDTIIERLIENTNEKHELDWVNSVCKKLPIMVLSAGLGFTKDDSNLISARIEELVKIMLPAKTAGEVEVINDAAREIYLMTENQFCGSVFFTDKIKSLSEKHMISTQKAASYFVSNLIGLFIQSYDAGRGILSNSLLQILNHGYRSENSTDRNYFKKVVIETLRFDPPVHNTRRVATDDMGLNKTRIKKGETIFLVLAAANRDPAKFDSPDIYDTERANNAEHLTFGTGGHMCPAKQLAMSLATDALSYLFSKHKTIRLIEKSITYEPKINVRLPKNIFISLS